MVEGPDHGPMEIAGFLASAQLGIVISHAGQQGVLGLGLSTSWGRAAAQRTRIIRVEVASTRHTF